MQVNYELLVAECPTFALSKIGVFLWDYIKCNYVQYGKSTIIKFSNYSICMEKNLVKNRRTPPTSGRLDILL